ncbi:hypothetical protein [Acuticoccus sp.]|uniref:hypothetical protein n=1 Tax=Acuticoccus sp. TaxID=1904378 RepID=UPI003B515DCA
MVSEKVNFGGKKLDPFELVTAIFAGTGFDLREDWYGNKTQLGRRSRMIGQNGRHDVLRDVANTDFLQACTILHTREHRLRREHEGVPATELPQVSCRRGAVLELPVTAYREHAASVEGGFMEAAKLMNEHKIVWHKDVPYPPLIVGLAAAFAISREGQAAAAREKPASWFWCMTLGELYGSATERGSLATCLSS